MNEIEKALNKKLEMINKDTRANSCILTKYEITSWLEEIELERQNI